MGRHLTLRNARRLVVAVVGGSLLLFGILLLVFPGPGWLVIFAGLALLGTEFVWARRLLKKARSAADKARQRLKADR